MPYSLAPSIVKGAANPQNGMTFGDMFAAPPQVGGFGYTEVTAAAQKFSGSTSELNENIFHLSLTWMP